MSQQSLPLDQSRLAHLGCPVKTLINDPHITSAAERTGILAASPVETTAAATGEWLCAVVDMLPRF